MDVRVDVSQLPEKCLPTVEYHNMYFEFLYIFLVKPMLVTEIWPFTTFFFSVKDGTHPVNS